MEAYKTFPSLGMALSNRYFPSIDDRWKYTYMPDIEEGKQKKESMEVSLDCTPYKDRFLKKATIVDKITVNHIPLGDAYPIGHKYVELVYCKKDGSEEITYVDLNISCGTQPEIAMRYKVGDKVRVKNIKTFSEYETERGYKIITMYPMERVAQQICTIDSVDDNGCYYIKELSGYTFAADMFEPVDTNTSHVEQIRKWWDLVKEKSSLIQTDEYDKSNDDKFIIPTIEPTFKFL